MQKIAILLFVGLFFSGCEEKKVGPYVIDIDLKILVIDSTGADLLDPSNPNSYLLDKIEVYYKVGDEWRLYNKPNLDAAKGFLIATDSKPACMILYPNIENVDICTETMVKWNEQDSDIIKCELLKRNEGKNISIGRIWLNNEIVWINGGDYPGYRIVEIIK